MQEHQAAEAAGEPITPSWYLLQDGKQFGPLSDRDLLLLAERGALKADGMLWQPGFADWKPAHEICGAGAASAAG